MGRAMKMASSRRCASVDSSLPRRSIRTFLCLVLQMQAMSRPDFVPRCDPEGEPVRNRFDPQCQRRIDINAVTGEQLAERIPGVGTMLAPKFNALKSAHTPSELAALLSEIPGFGQTLKGNQTDHTKANVDRALCFLTPYGGRPEATCSHGTSSLFLFEKGCTQLRNPPLPRLC